MDLIGRQVAVLHGLIGVTTLCVMMGMACADSGTAIEGSGGGAGSESVGPAKSWTRIEIVDHYTFKGEVAEDEDLSGIARLSDKLFVVGADEGRAVQVVELSPQAKTLKVVRTIPLVRRGQEIDIEAIAVEDDYCYVVGSHGISKKRGERQANRFKIFRLKMDRESGRVTDTATATLWDALGADPILGEYFQQPLQHKGVNIEGLAVRQGRLFVGFRSPSLGGYAFVMEVPADDLFAGRLRVDNVVRKLHLGEGLGIREIVAAKAGFLIIAGNSGSEPSETFTEAENYQEDRAFSMFLWDGENPEVHKIGSIPKTPGKAEAMTILEESPAEVTVLVVFDGPQGGRPTAYRIY